MGKQRKILSLDALLAMRAAARREGKTVVHCHGCFDIVHPGHIHHLEYAKDLGDLLIVSVSSDGNVNKGAARPLIPDDLRMSSLAALECVDYVYLNDTPTAVELLSQLQPDVFMKGREYERSTDPRFLAERDAVINAGGRVIFSGGEVVYSSTALIDSMTRTDPFQAEKLNRLRERYELSSESLHNLVHRFRGQKVVVIGDYVLDRYHFCDATGIAGEAPMMALRAVGERDYDGGAGVIALHLAGLGASPTLVTALADGEVSNAVELRLRAAGVNVQSVAPRRELVSKHRFIVEQSKLFKVDQGAATPLDSRAEIEVAERLIAASQGAAAVIFADFGYGMITEGLLDRVMPTLRQMVPVITADVSGKRNNLLRFQGVDLLCPTEREARESLQDFGGGLGAVVSELLRRTDAKQAIITLGKQGLVTFDWPGGDAAASNGRLRSEYVPALSAQTIDPLGCGDALLATASLVLAAGGSLQAAAYLGAAAAALQVQAIGNPPVMAETLLEMIEGQGQSRGALRAAS